MFEQRIRNLRLSRGLNQVQLADRLDVSKQSVSNWENDNIMPSVEMLEKIADFFAVSTDYLLGREQREHQDGTLLDVTGLTPRQIEHVKLLVDDLREGRTLPTTEEKN